MELQQLKNSSEVWTGTVLQMAMLPCTSGSPGPSAYLSAASRSSSGVCSFLSVCLKTLRQYWGW